MKPKRKPSSWALIMNSAIAGYLKEQEQQILHARKITRILRADEVISKLPEIQAEMKRIEDQYGWQGRNLWKAGFIAGLYTDNPDSPKQVVSPRSEKGKSSEKHRTSVVRRRNKGVRSAPARRSHRSRARRRPTR